MFGGAFVVVVALIYVGALFAIAWFGDRRGLFLGHGASSGLRSFISPAVYTLSLAVYCTSWTFFGGVGTAVRSGYLFLGLYFGPVLLYTLGLPLLLYVIRLSKKHNLTSIADFLAARYSKNQPLAAVVSVSLVIAMLPYIALQLKAISVSVEILLGSELLRTGPSPTPTFDGTSLLIALALAAFAILFGTRHSDASEHQRGLVVAVAAESIVKLIAINAVGIFAIYWFFPDIGEFYQRATQHETINRIFGSGIDGGQWLTITILSFAGALLLPRQFHVGVVENRSERDVRHAAWMFPLYLVLINLMVVPIAISGVVFFLPNTIDPDFFVLSLPIFADAPVMTLIAFLGGISAATAMVIVEAVALAIMICNGLVVPFLLKQRVFDMLPRASVTQQLLLIRRVAIVAILLMSYVVFRLLVGSQNLASLGFISLTAVAQIAPPFLGGLMWSHANVRGALAGLCAGFTMWVYTLLVPWIADAGWISPALLTEGPFGLAFLRPQALFNFQFDPLTHGVFWSLFANIVAFVTVSRVWSTTHGELLYAQRFLDLDRSFDVTPAKNDELEPVKVSVTVGELLAGIERYLGPDRARIAFKDYAEKRGVELSESAEADVGLFRLAEYLLSSSIGPASARLVLAVQLKGDNLSTSSTRKLLDDASEALQYNRDLLQLAIDQVRHGLCVFDNDMRLICWNRQFCALLDLPAEMVRVGLPLDKILYLIAERGDFGPGDPTGLAMERVRRLAVTRETFQENITASDGHRVLEIRTSPMPQGGIVTTFSNITDRIEAARLLEKANAGLEQRVRERTAELLQVNDELEEAKAKAVAANLDKTRFLAAAGHDILQPLNAARLYSSTLIELSLPEKEAGLAESVGSSLSAVEEIIAALIEIARLDAGQLKPEIIDISLDKLFQQLKLEFEPLAQQKGIDLRVAKTSVVVKSDRRMLRRVLQNLVSNAIKYTRSGCVLLGVRRVDEAVRIVVVDTGPGIPADKQAVIFHEFQRLEGAGSQISGLGLGLSIVERICRMLDTEIELKTTPGAGSNFGFKVPVSRYAPVLEPTQTSKLKPGTLQGRTVLCIDNEPQVRDSMRELLEAWGCEVLLADSVKSSVLTVKSAKKRPDVILADYHLDLGTGVQSIKAIADELDCRPPAIVITADYSPEVRNDVQDNGIGLLQKPVRAAALRALITHYLRNQRGELENEDSVLS